MSYVCICVHFLSIPWKKFFIDVLASLVLVEPAVTCI